MDELQLDISAPGITDNLRKIIIKVGVFRETLRRQKKEGGKYRRQRTKGEKQKTIAIFSLPAKQQNKHNNKPNCDYGYAGSTEKFLFFTPNVWHFLICVSISSKKTTLAKASCTQVHPTSHYCLKTHIPVMQIFPMRPDRCKVSH